METDKEDEFGEHWEVCDFKLSTTNVLTCHINLSADETSLLHIQAQTSSWYHVFFMCEKWISCAMLSFFLVAALQIDHAPFARRLTTMLNKMGPKENWSK